MFSNKEYLQFIQSSKSQSLDIVGVSVVQTLGSTYAKSGNMILINSNFEFVGVLGSTQLHNKLLELAKEVFTSKSLIYYENIPTNKTTGHGVSKYLIDIFLYKDNYDSLGLALENYGKTLIRSIDDNSFEIIHEKIETKLENGKFYQNIESPYSVLVFGSGAHVSSFISMANVMGWQTTIIDISLRKEYIKEVDEHILLDKLEDILTIDLSSYNASVILSHNEKTDDTYLQAILNSNVEYIGILGNKKNMLKKKKQFNLENDDRVFAPVGLDIGGNTHQSIALCICAQIEAKRNNKSV